MAVVMPEPSPGGDQPEDGGPRFVWVPGSVDDNGVELSGLVPPEMMPGYQPVEHMPPGQALGGWLEVASAAAPGLDEDQLTGGGDRCQSAGGAGSGSAAGCGR